MFTIKYIIFWGSYLAIPCAYGLLLLFQKKKKWRIWIGVLLFLNFLFLYARFLEPHILTVKRETLSISRENLEHSERKTLRIALFSDTHVGIYKNTLSLSRIVEKVNAENPDIVLIPGDFLYELAPEKISQELLELRKLEASTFVVTGNHDVGQPGPDYGDTLTNALKSMNLHVVDDEKVGANIQGQSLTIVGLSDIWDGKTQYPLLNNLPEETLNIVLVHNPDATYYFPTTENIDLVVAGHTHGGQVRIPILYKSVIPCVYDFDRGYYDVDGMNVYVTSGTGMTGLPLRLFIPPEIVMIEMEY